MGRGEPVGTKSGETPGSHRKRSAGGVDELLTDVFVGLAMVALIAGVVSLAHA